MSRKLSLRLTTNERKTILALVDIFLINASLLVALSIWRDFLPVWPIIIDASKWFVTLTILWLCCGLLFDIYNLARAGSVSEILANVGLAVLLTDGLYLATPWLTPSLAQRSYAFGFVFLSLVTMLGWRVLYARVFYQPAFRRRTLIVGTGKNAEMLMRNLDQASQVNDANPFRGTGYQVLGMVSEKPMPQVEEDDADPVVGDIWQLIRLVREKHVNEIIVALDADDAVDLAVYEVLLDCRELGIPVSSLASVYERLTARLPVEYAGADVRVLLGPEDNPATRLYLSVKRLVDMFLALCGMIPLALVVPWVALSNAIWSPGPLFYRQERVGRGGKPFALIKFRSMNINAERTTGVVWSQNGDLRVTPAGRWLRRTRLDELPQVINVLRGEMSVVGPRPERPHFVGQLARQLPLYRSRHAVKPGITGWAQVRYHYGDTVEDSRVKLEYDLYYVKHASAYLDLLILLQTIPSMIQLKGR